MRTNSFCNPFLSNFGHFLITLFCYGSLLQNGKNLLMSSSSLLSTYLSYTLKFRKICSRTMIHSNVLFFCCFALFANAHHIYDTRFDWQQKQQQIKKKPRTSTTTKKNSFFKQKGMKTCVPIVCVYVLSFFLFNVLCTKCIYTYIWIYCLQSLNKLWHGITTWCVIKLCVYVVKIVHGTKIALWDWILFVI